MTIEPRVLMAPTNVAMNPMMLTEEFQRRGMKANHLRYSSGSDHPLGFRSDRIVSFGDHGGRVPAMLATLDDVLRDDYNIFHFWAKTLLFETTFGGISGMDLPILKSHGRKIVHRFTGFDARTPAKDRDLNPFSPFHYGYEYPYVEAEVERHQELVSGYADRLIVQDPELGQFFPEATVVPRALTLAEWEYVGPTTNDRLLVVHAPTNTVVKGTPQVVDAVETLQRRGLKFDFKLIEGMAQPEAREWFRKADVIVDQLLIGATGVLTLEAWALGKPVVVNLRPELFNAFYETDDLPVVQANPDTIVESLAAIITDADRREVLSQRGRSLVERFHDVGHIADQLDALYREVLDATSTSTSNTADVATMRAVLAPPKVEAPRRAPVRAPKPQAKTSSVTPVARPQKSSLPQKVVNFVWRSSPSEYAFKIGRFFRHAKRDIQRRTSTKR